uniref:Uncharacterized protein n=1 Tax=Lygus hesperus TaxID=30085 RepID=A0A146MD61_LYGHE
MYYSKLFNCQIFFFQIVTAGVLFLVVGAVVGGEVEIHGDQTKQNRLTTQTLGASVTDQRNKFAIEGLRSGDYDRGHVEYGRQLLTNADGTKSLNGHAGLTRDNYGNQAKNFGLGYQDPKTSVNWDRQLSGPVRTDTYRAERNFYSSPDGRATLGGYLQHDRNNFGMRNTGGGIVGRYNFPG